ncbi:MAG: peptidoglycan DD-metalloendopeptidase family protein [Steroidobacterales bacterium]
MSCAVHLVLACCGGVLQAQALYKYRDASGAWVYSDRQPPAGTKAETMTVDLAARAPRITVEQSVDGVHLRLSAVNECACDAQFAVQIDSAGNVSLPPVPAVPDKPDAKASAGMFHADLKPNSRQALLTAPYDGPGVTGFRYSWRAVLGTPGATHSPHEPYRAPFALGASFRVSQAYPTHVTHTTPDSEYAVDIAVPDGTPIYAAREGSVINVRHDSFRGAADPAMLDQANIVEILHDDGTIGLYAHLHWESIRVQPGQSVRRGQYIADSGNTGLSTGPHLHFAVIRNAGMHAESVPVQFAGANGTTIAPQTGILLTAY